MFGDGLTPVIFVLLAANDETELLIEMTGWIKSCESRQVDPPEVDPPTEVDGLMKQKVPESLPLKFGIDDEPAEAGTHGPGFLPIDDNGTDDSSVSHRYPETVVCLVEPVQELGQLCSYLGLEEEIKAPVFVIIGGMEFGNPSDCAWNVT